MPEMEIKETVLKQKLNKPELNQGTESGITSPGANEIFSTISPFRMNHLLI